MDDLPAHPKTLAEQVIIFLALQKGEWCTWGPSFYMPSVQSVMPVGTSEDAQLRYMQLLQRQGFVGGCDCGCRGDYSPTELGIELIERGSRGGWSTAKEYRRNGYSYGY